MYLVSELGLGSDDSLSHRFDISRFRFCGFFGEESSHSGPRYPQSLLFANAFCTLSVHLVLARGFDSIGNQ